MKPRLPFEIWALVAGSFAVALGYGVVAPAIPQFALAFGVSNFAASAIVSAFALMRLVSAPFAGWVIARLGERSTYTIGLFGVALSTGLAAFATSYSQFVLLRAAGGIGSAMFTVSATALIAKLSPPNARGRVASLNSAGFLLGGLLGPVLGGAVAVFGLRAPFVLYFFALIVAAMVVAVALRKSTLAAMPKPAPDSNSKSPRALTAVLQLGDALKIAPYRTLLFSVFAFGWASFGVRVSVIPLLVVVGFGSDATAAAWVLAAYAAGNAVLIFPSGRWNDNIGRKPMLIVGMGVLAASYFFIPLTPTLWALAAVLAVAGAGSALVNPGQQAVLADVLNQRRGGNTVAVYSMSSDFGAMLGPAIAGLVVDVAGFGWAFALTGMLLAGAAIAWTFVADTRRAN